MAITIDGNGTIGGITVGGLPDSVLTSNEFAAGAVNTAALADNAITTAKITDGAVTAAKTSVLLYRLNAGLAGSNATGAQNWLGVGVTLASNTVYDFEGVVQLSKSAGTTAHTVSLLFGGTAVLNNIAYEVIGGANNGTASPIAGSNNAVSQHVSSAAGAVVTGSITTANYFVNAYIRGTVSVATGGTFIPQYSLSAAPGGAYTAAQGSLLKLTPIGASGSNSSIGTWA